MRVKIEAPCKIGQTFHVNGERVALTGINIHKWKGTKLGYVLLSKKDVKKDRISRTFRTEDTAEGAVISFDIPDEMLIPGYPLSALGLEMNAVGYVGGVRKGVDGCEYFVHYGTEPGTTAWVKTPERDRMFGPVI